MKRRTFRLATLGCRTNQYETQAYRDQLTGLDFVEACEGEEADLCIINTCTVTESADSSSRHQIRQLVRQNPRSRVVVTGCASDKLHTLEGVSEVIPNERKEELIAELFPDEVVPEFSIKNFEAHTRAFVKVQDGCNSFCTYCIIPYVRGRSRSRPLPAVIREVEELVGAGFKEVVITGINVGDYDGGGDGTTLADLITAVDQVPGIERVRLSSIDPDEVDEALARSIIEGKHTCHSMHIVLQSGSNVILKRMNRKYTRQIFLETVEKLRSVDPAFTFTTDVIVGFPGESEEDFAETLDVMRQTRFAKVHMFPYSVRSRTRAALYKDPIDPKTMQARKRRVLQLSEEIAYALRGSFVGQRMKVLTENGKGGHTENFLPVMIPDQKFKPNELIDVQLVSNTPEGLVGR